MTFVLDTRKLFSLKTPCYLEEDSRYSFKVNKKNSVCFIPQNCGSINSFCYAASILSQIRELKISGSGFEMSEIFWKAVIVFSKKMNELDYVLNVLRSIRFGFESDDTLYPFFQAMKKMGFTSELISSHLGEKLKIKKLLPSTPSQLDADPFVQFSDTLSNLLELFKNYQQDYSFNKFIDEIIVFPNFILSHQEFMRDLGMTTENILHHEHAERLYLSGMGVSYEDINEQFSQLKDEVVIARKKLLKGFDLDYSKWHPIMKIQDLSKEIENHGPLMVLGHWFELGEDANPSLNVSNRTFYNFNQSHLVHEDSQQALIIVGTCMKGGKQFVFVVDPYEFMMRGEKKVYFLSYESFTERICSLEGYTFRTDEEVKYLSIHKLNRYAVHS